MRLFLPATLIMVFLSSTAVIACEMPVDDSYYLEALEEERQLAARALNRSDLVFVGTVRDIKYGPETPSPSDRVSEVEVVIGEVLVGSPITVPVVTLNANLHHQFVVCFGNEAFWDDQVEVGGDYILFVAAGKIVSASPLSKSWKKLGLSGQREVVLSLTRGR